MRCILCTAIKFGVIFYYGFDANHKLYEKENDGVDGTQHTNINGPLVRILITFIKCNLHNKSQYLYVTIASLFWRTINSIEEDD